MQCKPPTQVGSFIVTLSHPIFCLCEMARPKLLTLVSPGDSKEARAAAVSPFIEGGDVELPAVARAPWVADFVNEAAAFPNGTHDDQVDACTQALARLLLESSDAADYMQALTSERGTDEQLADRFPFNRG